ncbi:peptidase S28, Tetratricopeptide-like helical domain, DYW domain protein [Artemisia annua]|uniref:Peptidase S28, Tetratricopeptide-like helical domain, DYW domain protein n=1 Tax=Artemisia annua TaxID=35608 RepID=A0A2U1M6X5_ARTAN|nr:peptidase S28, Tetratricopeptide-like helical domain, DYW domain protein [Artemisia annua]
MTHPSDDEKKRILSGHNEKLALAYGLLVDCGTIRITTNVRICEDFHVVMCGASKITGREIIRFGRLMATPFVIMGKFFVDPNLQMVGCGAPSFQNLKEIMDFLKCFEDVILTKA